MPLPDDVRARVNDPGFWRRYLVAERFLDSRADSSPDDDRRTAAYEAAYAAAAAEGADIERFDALLRAELDARDVPPHRPDVVAEFPVGGGYALVVEGFFDSWNVSLDLRTPTRAEPQLLGYLDGSHPHRQTLRWAELDLIGRAVAVADPTVRHPGPVLAFASAFVVLDDDDDLDAITPLMDSAYGPPPPGAPFWPSTRRWLHSADGRRGGVRWQQDEAGNWLLTQDAEKRWDFPIHSLREVDFHDDFPFDGWRGLLAAAETTLAGDLPVPRSPVEECWIEEVRTGAPPGSLVKARFGPSPLTGGRIHELSLEIPVEGRAQELMDDLDRTLREADRGWVDLDGARGTPITNIRVRAKVVDDLHAGLAMIREVLRSHAVRPGAEAIRGNERIALS